MINWGVAFYVLGVICIHLANSGPDILLLLLKALISISAPSSPVSIPPLILHSQTPSKHNTLYLV